MGRPRSVTDAEVLAIARACITEHGPGVPLQVIARAVGLSAPGLVKRFGSKERLMFAALLPAGPPAWVRPLQSEPGPDAHQVLVDVMVDLCREFAAVGPALAALRMSPLEVDRVFPPGQPGPSRVARERIASWLARAGVGGGDPEAAADLLVGAAEARGFLGWVGPQMVAPGDDRAWAQRALAAIG